MSKYVYFLREVKGCGPIKIGSSWRGGAARAKDISRRDCGIFTCIAQWETPRCANIYEARLHAHFEPHHLGGEWFDPADELLGVVDAINSGTFKDSMITPHGWCVTKRYQTKASIAHWGILPRLTSEGRAA